MQKILFIILLLSPIIGISQNRIVEGKIIAFSKHPIKNITVIAKKSKSKSTTDKNGVFRIEVKRKDVIKIKNPLFLMYEKRISKNTDFIEINLIFDETDKNISQAIDEGYFTKDNLEYALRNLYRENNVYNLFTDVYEAIKYAIPEATLVENTNGGKAFILRGINSLKGNNNALYLVNQNLMSDISFIPPSEIRRIRKLSNSEAAIYGSRARNGVISIETY